MGRLQSSLLVFLLGLAAISWAETAPKSGLDVDLKRLRNVL